MRHNDHWDINWRRTLRTLRRTAFFSQAELAEELGVSLQSVKAWESKTRRRTPYDRMKKRIIDLCKAYEVSPRRLAEGERREYQEYLAQRRKERKEKAKNGSKR